MRVLTKFFLAFVIVLSRFSFVFGVLSSLPDEILSEIVLTFERDSLVASTLYFVAELLTDFRADLRKQIILT